MTNKAIKNVLLVFMVIFWVNGIEGVGKEEAQKIEFEHLSIAEGLSQSTVFCIMQDQVGFLWFGTQNGLNRYDGHSFKWFLHDPKQNSISYNMAASLCQDEDGIIWIGTWGGGLNRFDPITEKFDSYESISTIDDTLSDNNVWVIHRDKKNKNILWIGTENGLNRFDKSIKDKKIFKRYLYTKEKSEEKSKFYIINVIYEDDKHMLVGTNKGLFKYDREKDKFIELSYHTLNESQKKIKALCLGEDGRLWVGTEGGLGCYNSDSNLSQDSMITVDWEKVIGSVIINTILKDKEGLLWIGLFNEGIIRFNPKSKKSNGPYVYDSSNPGSLSYNDIRSIYQDKTGLIWIGTYGGGINKYDPRKRNFDVFRHNQDSQSMSDNDVMSIVESGSNKYKGKIWVATRGGGLDLFDPGNGTFQRFGKPFQGNEKKDNPKIRAIWEEPNGKTLWVGMEKGGMYRFDINTDKFEQNLDENLKFEKEEYILCIRGSGDGFLWIGTMDGGLIRIDKNRTGFKRFKDNNIGLKNNKVFTLHDDREESGVLWIGTGNGLYRFQEKNGNEEFKEFKAIAAEPDSINNNLILSIHEDGNHVLWIGTNGGGLNRMDKKLATFTAITPQDGLANDTIYDILEDNQGRLWLSTNKGLSRYNPKGGSIRNFTVRDGLQSYEFSRWAALKAGNGKLYFGGLNGLNQFNPAAITDLTKPPKIVLTSVKKSANELAFDPTQPGAILELSYKDSIISFEFAALDFTDPASNQYEYKLREKDNWIKLGNRHEITFPKIEPGDYSLLIRGCNSEYKWNKDGIAINIVVHPPLWKKWWFAPIFILGAAGILTFLVRRRIQNIEQKQQALAREIEERKKVEAQLKESEELYRTLVETSPEAIILCDLKGKIVMTNKQPAILLGYRDVNELMEKNHNFFKLVARQDRTMVRKAFEAGETRNFEFELLACDGTTITAESSIAMIKDREDKPQYFLAITRDIRERKEAEKRARLLTQVDKMVSLGTLVSGIAHELNNPAGYIMINAENFSRVWTEIESILDFHYQNNPDFQVVGMAYESARTKIKDLISAQLEGSHRIKNIIQELKEYSRPEDSIKKAVDINRILNSSLNLTGSTIRKNTNALVVNLEENIPAFWGSPQKLEQVFINLIQNACDALNSREKGIEISSQFDREKNQIVAKVKDEGVGMNEKTMKQIFDPFFTTKRTTGGTGLGLSISSQIIKEHGGQMFFKSELGQGTTVTVILPAASFIQENNDQNKKQ